MMTHIDLAQNIARIDFNVDQFSTLIIQDPVARTEMITCLLSHADINVYYHAFYIITHACEQEPVLFYPYWSQIAALLDDKNSYHRDFGLTLLSRLTCVDDQNQFEILFPAYFGHVNDKKFMTALCCIRQIPIILHSKPQLLQPVMSILLDINTLCLYPDKQKSLLKYDVLEIMAAFYGQYSNPQQLNQFIRAENESISPKTRRKARELIKRLNL